MTTLYGLWGPTALSWLTRGGRVLAHPDRGELEFLFTGANVRPLRGVAAEDLLLVRDLPEYAGVRFPLRREDFW